MERDIYINASSISHFTQFNHFTKPNDEVSLLSKYNSWFANHTVQQQETLSQMVNKLSVSEVSYLDKALESIAEPVISQPEPIPTDKPTTSEPRDNAELAQKLYARMEKVIESKKEGEQIPIPNLTANLRDLNIAVEQTVTLNRGILHESQDIQASGLNIVSHNVFYKRELLRFSHKDTLYRVLVGGRVDGLLGDTIVETKHRRNRLFNCIYKYEKVQIEIYLFLLDKKKCLHIENFNGESNQIYYDRDPNFLAEIKLQVQHRLIELLNEWVYKVEADENEPEETAAREDRETTCQSE